MYNWSPCSPFFFVTAEKDDKSREDSVWLLPEVWCIVWHGSRIKLPKPEIKNLHKSLIINCEFFFRLSGIYCIENTLYIIISDKDSYLPKIGKFCPSPFFQDDIFSFKYSENFPLSPSFPPGPASWNKQKIFGSDLRSRKYQILKTFYSLKNHSAKKYDLLCFVWANHLCALKKWDFF